MLRGEDVKMKNKVQLAPCIFGFRIPGFYQLWSWLYRQMRNPWMQRAECTHCTVSFYIKDLSTLRFEYWEEVWSWNQSFMDAEGQLYLYIHKIRLIEGSELFEKTEVKQLL